MLTASKDETCSGQESTPGRYQKPCRAPPRHARLRSHWITSSAECNHQGSASLVGYWTHQLQLRLCLLLLRAWRAAPAGQMLALKAPPAVVRRLGRHVLLCRVQNK